MKASINKRYGTPDVLSVEEREKPIPGEGELLVQVKAATVNRTDCAYLKAKPYIMRLILGLFSPRKKTGGTDFAGVVESVGSGVTAFKAGDRVFGFDDMVLSSHAEYLIIKETKPISLIPDKVSFEHAAASVEGAHYARNFINKVKISKGESVLVYGATGAIGSAMVQLLKEYDVHITAVCTEETLELVEKLGADRVIDYTKGDFTKAVDRKFDYVFDAVGKSSFGICKSILTPQGIYISSELGAWNQNLFYAFFSPLSRGKKVGFPFPVDTPATLSMLKRLMEEEMFTPVIDRTYPLEEIAEAFRYVASGKKIGNVVLTMNS